MRDWRILWFSLVTGALVVGGGIGATMDYFVGVVSWDYVFPAREFWWQSWRWSPIVGTVLAAAAVVGRYPPPRLSRAFQHLGVAAVIVVAAGGLGAAAGGIIGKTGHAAGRSPTLAPPARIWFCRGLSSGVALGTVAGSLVAVAGIWNARRHTPEMADVGDRSVLDQIEIL